MLTRRSTFVQTMALSALLLLLSVVLPGCAGLSMLGYVLEEPYPTPPPQEVHLGTRGSPSVTCSHEDGWRLLAQRRDVEAQWFFMQQIDQHPREGEPLIGYALASAFLDEINETEIAMRQALRIDPNSVSVLILEPRVRVRVKRLAGRWYDLQRCGPTADGVLVLGTIHVMLRDYEAAYYATEISLYLGDRGPAVRALYRVVRAKAPRLESSPRRADERLRVARRPAPPNDDVVGPPPTSFEPRSSVLTEPVEDVSPSEVPDYDAPRPGLRPSSTILDDPEALPEPWGSEPESTEPVRYEDLRENISGMSDAVGRFEEKLLDRIAESTSAY